MGDLRQYKETENKVHEQLYDNLFLLSQLYPTSKEFNTIFKKDMFVKNNKTAFFEVVYYLLNTLNKELTKMRITMWPPYDVKRENKFRAEVLKCINELNDVYDNADIPHIMPSHLISPGGFKFAKFMLKLSQLVVYEHLKKTEKCDILYCLKPSKSIKLTKVNILNLKKKTAIVGKETKITLEEFQSSHSLLNEKALLIDKELKELNIKIREAKQKNAEVREEFVKSYPSYPSFESLEEKVSLLKKEWDNLQEVQNLFTECDKLISYLSSGELVLEHDKDKLKLPNEVLHIIRNRDQLDLQEFFYALNILLEQKALDLPNPTSSFLDSHAEKVKDLNQRYTNLHNSLAESVEKLREIIERLSIEIKMLAVTVENKEEEEVLAVPLVDLDKSE